MALTIRSKKVEDLAWLLANRTGSTVPDAIEEALRARLIDMDALPEQVLERLQAIAKACTDAPNLDTRPAEEVLGYNTYGIFSKGH